MSFVILFVFTIFRDLNKGIKDMIKFSKDFGEVSQPVRTED